MTYHSREDGYQTIKKQHILLIFFTHFQNVYWCIRYYDKNTQQVYIRLHNFQNNAKGYG